MPPAFEIEARALTRRFGDFTAVDAIDLAIPRGAIFGFLGPNGSGKSTTVKMLTGLLQPTSGEALVTGAAVTTAATEVKRRIGVLPETLALFDALTIEEHLRMAGPVYGLSAAETETRAEQLLRFLDLWDQRRTFADQGSFGMRKKTALALALLHNPRVLFLDEPFEGIDPATARNIRDLLVTIAAKGVTIFLTSHILEIVSRLVTQVAMIRGGRIVFSGAMSEIGDRLEQIYFENIESQKAGPLEWLG